VVTSPRAQTLLVALIAAVTALRIVNLQFPERPVFDEVHFATYASDYAVGRPHFDIHPPLGKLLYALPLLATPPGVRDIEFITFSPDTERKTTGTILNGRTTYDAFPYLSLRLLSILFGAFLIAAVYAFLTILTRDPTPGLIAAVFLATDAAFAVDARGIFLNGMFLTFAFAALACAVYARPKPILGGILLGLALSVKLIAIVFVPIFVLLLAHDPRRTEKDRTFATRWRVRSVAVAFAVLALFTFIPNALVYSNNERLAVYRVLLEDQTPSDTTPAPWAKTLTERVPAVKSAALSMLEFELAIVGYTVGPPHTYASPWYAWPFAAGPMPYYVVRGAEADGVIALVGNPVVWGLAIALSLTSAVLIRRTPELSRWPLFVLFIGYLASFLPFALLARSTFMYHYFPGLIFSFGIAALFLRDCNERADPRTARAVGTLIVVALLAGFWLMVPYVLGLPSIA
jgi:dolichyl-phosphate-mannose--protein O-mannosyl transferase